MSDVRVPVMPPVYFVACFLGAGALHTLCPIITVAHPPLTYLGVLLIVVGLGAIVHVSQVFVQRNTPIKPGEQPRALVVDGLFRYSRNPMYVSAIIALAGQALLLGSLSPWVTPIIMWSVLKTQFIPMEEQLMHTTFGSAYRDYTQRVRRWV